ncbi:MAG: NIPSNAP family protein [Deinococcales bacterium]|jgi:hypothetical protein
MIVIRDVFKLEFGKARDAQAAMREMRPLLERLGMPGARVLTDLVGEYYTMVLETTAESLAAYESGMATLTQNDEWQRLYARFVPLVRHGYREILRTVE